MRSRPIPEERQKVGVQDPEPRSSSGVWKNQQGGQILACDKVVKGINRDKLVGGT